MYVILIEWIYLQKKKQHNILEGSEKIILEALLIALFLFTVPLKTFLNKENMNKNVNAY